MIRHTGDLWLILCLAAWCLAAPPAFGGDSGPAVPVSFEREIIRIFVEPDSLRIEGLYFLRGSGDREQVVPLTYPYPEDERLGGARTEFLRARTTGDWTPLSFGEKSAGNGARWWVPVSPGQAIEVHTVYRQQRLDDYARYIVTTTRAWRRPLARARFEVYLPEGVRPRSWSYPFEPGQGEQGACWVYEATDFWPDRDITVSWDPPVASDE